MRGSVEERRPGVWHVRFDLPPDPVTGGRRQRSRTVHGSRGDAETTLAVLAGEVAAGSWTDPQRITVAEFADRWLGLIAATVRPKTLDSYRQKLRLACTLIGPRRLADLRGDTLTEIYRTLPRSAQTIVHVHRVLHRMCADAQRWGVLPTNPASTAMPPTVRRKKLHTWTAAEVGQFLAVTVDDPLGPLFRVACASGMRRGELCGLRWERVNLGEGVLTVDQATVMVRGRPQLSEPKTRAGRRRISLDRQTVAVLAQLQARQTEDRQFFGDAYQGGWVFCWEDGRPFSPDYVTHQFRRLVDVTGLPRIRFHDLRHTWATLALSVGVPAKVVSDRLGHAGIAITLDTYTHHVEALDRAAAEQVAGLFGTQDGTHDRHPIRPSTTPSSHVALPGAESAPGEEQGHTA